MPPSHLLTLSLPVALLGVSLASTAAHAATINETGTFTSDAQVYSYSFTTTMAQTYTFATTSYATGGFLPVLTLFNTTTGNVLGTADGSPMTAGVSGMDATLMSTLGPGSYVLALSELPNVAVGQLADGFLLSQYADGATYTGDNCSVTGGMFYNSVDCSKRTGNYALAVTSVAPVPEPATWALMLPGAGLALLLGKRHLA